MELQNNCLDTMRPVPASGRVLQNPDLLAQVLKHTPEREQDRLQEVGRLWCQTLRGPQFWQPRFAPYVLHAPSQSIYTLSGPINAGRPDPDLWEVQPMRRQGAYLGGKAYTLRTGANPIVPRSGRALKILDESTKIRGWRNLTGHYIFRFPELYRETQRSEELHFLLHRAYRMRHGLPNTVWRENSMAQAVGYGVLCGLMCIYWGVICGESEFASRAPLSVAYFATKLAVMIILLLELNHKLESAYGQKTGRNLFKSYQNYRDLNRLAWQMLDIQKTVPLPLKLPQWPGPPRRPRRSLSF